MCTKVHTRKQMLVSSFFSLKAIKRLRMVEIKEEALKDFKREVSTLTQLRNPNLVLFMGATTESNNVCIVTEYCQGGSLFALLHESLTVNLSWN
jgi:serine/threonine protein kinase